MARTLLHFAGGRLGVFNYSTGSSSDLDRDVQMCSTLWGSGGSDVYGEGASLPQDRVASSNKTSVGLGRYAIRTVPTTFIKDTTGGVVPRETGGTKICVGFRFKVSGFPGFVFGGPSSGLFECTYKVATSGPPSVHECFMLGYQIASTTTYALKLYRHRFDDGATPKDTYTLLATGSAHTGVERYCQVILDTTGGTPRARVWVDGTLEMTVTDAAVTTQETQWGVNHIQISGSLNLDFFISDWCVDELDADADRRSTFPDVIAVQPTNDLDDASVDEWTSSTGGENKYREVDDFNDNVVPLDDDPDNDYIYPTAADQRQMFAFADLSAGTVEAVNYWLMRETEGPNFLRLCDGTNVSEVAPDYEQSFHIGGRLMAHPDGGAWDRTKLNAIQAGFKSTDTTEKVHVVGFEVLGTGFSAFPSATPNAESNSADAAALCGIAAAATFVPRVMMC